MKNIKEIMSEMTGLSKQIAVTINNEELSVEDTQIEEIKTEDIEEKNIVPQDCCQDESSNQNIIRFKLLKRYYCSMLL